MADAMLSAAAERLIDLIAEQARYHINLVRGAEKEVLSLAKKLESIRIVLDDAENRRLNDKKINYWMSRLEATSYEMEDILDEWGYAILKLHMDEHDSDDDDVVAPAPKQKVCSFIPSSLCFKKICVRHRIAKKILNVKDQYDEILKEKEQFNFLISQPTPDPTPESLRIQSTSLIDVANVHGRERDRDILVGKLMDNGCSQEELGIQVVSIVGVGGLGKTTLAQLVYNHSRVEESFKLRVWICVSDPFDLTVIAKGILESIEKGSSPNTNQLDVLLKCVQESVLGKKFLLVLDDVWTEDYNKWEPLESSLSCGGAGSKILVTTRSERVAKKMGTRESEIFSPGLLSDEDCWLFMCRMALPGRNKEGFEDIGKRIAKKCKGLPFAAKTLGSLLRFKSTLEEWTNVLNSEIWKMEEVEVDIFPHLLLSYNELSSNLKRCFSYCAVIPKDSEIVVDTLIEKWMSLGYLGSNTNDIEVKGRGYFDILSMRSLFQEFKKDDLDEITSCKMHDIVHDFAQFLRKSGRLEAARMNKTCRACDPLLVSSVNEFCTLTCVEESPPKHCDCLIRLRVLSFINCGLQSIPQGMENLIHLRWLELYGINKLSPQDFKTIFQLYYLQTLSLQFCNVNEIPGEIGKLIHLRSLRLSGNESLEELPQEIKNLIHLRLLELSRNKSLKELPKEIGNLIQLRHLIIKKNDSLKELPMEIGNLINLRHLDVSWNKRLKDLPSEIGNLIHLRCLDVRENDLLQQLPDSICRLHELQTLNVDNDVRALRLPNAQTGYRFVSAFSWSKLGLLKKLNHLVGVLRLKISLNNHEVVEDARDAELRNKIHIQKLEIFWDQIDEMEEEEEEESSRVRMDVLDALEPHPNLQELKIELYGGSKLPLGWIVSPLNQLRKVNLSYCNHLTSLLPFGKLPCLENIQLYYMEVLQFVGREFLGITATIGGGDILNVQSSSITNVIAFPKLKRLEFSYCGKWTEWEDITKEEEECAGFQVMPCLTELEINNCYSLTALPHRLLRKASLEMIDISGSMKLQKRYANPDQDNLFFHQLF